MMKRTLASILPMLLVASHASAQSEASVRADALFAQGKSDMSAGRIGAACAAFAESHALDPAEGTLLALGLCHEQEGRLVRAWKELRDVQAAAMKSGRDDRQRVARAALGRIEPRIGRLAMKACRAPRIDDVRVSETDEEIVVEPGLHRIACDRRSDTWQGDLTVAGGTIAVVVVPEQPAEAPAPRPPVETSTPWLGWSLAGAGAIALGVGTAFGIRAVTQWNAVRSECDPDACRSPSAAADASSAKRSALVADVTVGAGALLVGAGIVLVLTHGSAREAVKSGGRVAF